MEKKLSKEEFVEKYGQIEVYFVSYSYFTFHFECAEYEPFNISISIVLDCDEFEYFEVEYAKDYRIDYLAKYGNFIARHTNGFHTEPDEDE